MAHCPIRMPSFEFVLTFVLVGILILLNRRLGSHVVHIFELNVILLITTPRTKRLFNKMMLQLFGMITILGLALASQVSPVDILKAIQDMDDCSSCLEVLVRLQVLARLGDEALVGTLTTVCDLTDVCKTFVRPCCV